MTKFKLLFAMFFMSLTFIGCDPNDNSSPTQNDDTFAENFGNEVSRSFIGQVVDNNNLPMKDVEIKIGTSTVQTDINGVFIINEATVYEKFAYIKATKAGYIDGSRAMVPTSGKNNVKIMLIPNTPLETIQSGVASEVSIYSGTKVNFDGAFADENGNAYTGTVSVSMFHLTPSDDNMDKLMPGMLYAQNAINQEVVLETFGMMNVELRGSGGQKLNIAEGHTAEITMLIDDAQLATAPNSIPLWHFDEEKGYWKEDGVATKTGNKYVGEVSHFSWWNCDAPFQTVLLTTSVIDANGNPLPNIGIGLTPDGMFFTNIAYTDANGNISGLIPANQTITLNVYHDCGIIYITTIGPFSSDTVLPAIVIPSSAITSTKINGTLLNCGGSNVTNGYVLLPGVNGDQIINVTNGSFSHNATFCTSITSFSLRAVDWSNLQTSTPVNYTITGAVTNVGALTTCNSITDYIFYKLDDRPVRYMVGNIGGGYNSSTLPFSAWGMSGGLLHVVGYTITPGVYDSNTFQLYDHVDGVYTYENEDLIYNLKSFGAVGQLLEMTLAGTFDDQFGVTHTLSATFHLKRTQ